MGDPSSPARVGQESKLAPDVVQPSAVRTLSLATPEQPGKALVGQQSTPKASFYQRLLPTSAPATVVHVPFTSRQSQQFLSTAIFAGFASNYFYLADQHLTQSEPAYCGLATLCLILNAAAVDPQRNWKGIWRWFDQEMLDCCRPLASVKEVGITMDEFACLARCNTLQADVKRDSSLEVFRQDVKASTSSQGELFLAASYSRKTLGQTGDGHFSPIAAYTGEADDMILVLDVARFKYGSYWIPLEAMWKAMDTIDAASGQKRGYCLLSKTSLTTDDPQQVSVVRTTLNKLSVKALFESAILQRKPTLEDLRQSDELARFSTLIELISIDSIGEEDVATRAQLQARQQDLLGYASLADLFVGALHAYLVEQGRATQAPTDPSYSTPELAAAVGSIKSQIAALHMACCQEEALSRPC
jgi:hypothetical protein